jgi:hypothetical protein
MLRTESHSVLIPAEVAGNPETQHCPGTYFIRNPINLSVYRSIDLLLISQSSKAYVEEDPLFHPYQVYYNIIQSFGSLTAVTVE